MCMYTRFSRADFILFTNARVYVPHKVAALCFAIIYICLYYIFSPWHTLLQLQGSSSMSKSGLSWLKWYLLHQFNLQVYLEIVVAITAIQAYSLACVICWGLWTHYTYSIWFSRRDELVSSFPIIYCLRSYNMIISWVISDSSTCSNLFSIVYYNIIMWRRGKWGGIFFNWPRDYPLWIGRMTSKWEMKYQPPRFGNPRVHHYHLYIHMPSP